MHLKVITPKKIVLDEEIDAISVPSSEGEMTILPHHANFFGLLKEGIVRIRTKKDEQMLSIGGGYVETNGEAVTVLVSKAYRQEEIDHALTEKAISDAKKILSESKNESERQEAASLLRRSLIDMKLLKKKAPRHVAST